MKITKGGRVFCPSGESGWDKDTFMTPHAIIINKGEIRLYGGCRDINGISRIRYVDVKADNPSEIIKISKNPVLDIGNDGCFDDNGVILGDVIPVNNRLYMYYVGFQHVQKVKFYAFSGLAISDDNGESFHRYSEVPVLDRTSTARYGRCIHTVLHENNVFKCWYAVINGWKVINAIPYPVYDIWYTESEDGMHFPLEDSVRCISTQNNEYRIGRPKVYKTDTGYEMYYTRDLVPKQYLIGYAVSKDGIHWERKDDEFVIPVSDTGWDSEMTCYPVRVQTGTDTLIFYNGNDMGRTGVGYAVLAE